MSRVLDRLAQAAPKLQLASVQRPSLPTKNGELVTNGTHTNDKDSAKITQKYIWKRLGHFLKPGDVMLADTGTASYGLPSCPLPEGAT